MTKFYRETQFKETEIGRIPEDWEVVRLGEVFKVVPNLERKVLLRDKDIYKLVYVKLYAKGIRVKEEKRGAEISSKYLYYLKEGDFIFSKINLRKGAFDFVPRDLAGSYVTSEHPILELKNPNVLRDFVKVYLSQPRVWNEFKKVSKGFSGKDRIKPAEFLMFSIPLPPIEEQRAIAGVLRQFDELVEVIDKKIESLQRIKKGLMDVYFTKGVFEHREFKETEIGRIPEDWEVVRLGEVVKIGHRKVKLQGDKIPFIPMSYVPNKTQFIREWELRSQEEIKSEVLVRKGDLLVARITPSFENGNQGIIEELPGEWGYATTEVFPIWTDKTNLLDLLYVAYYLKHPKIRKSLAAKMEGTTGRQRLPKYVLKLLPIPLPPIEEQKEIARRLKDVDDQIENLRELRESVERMKKRVMDLLLTGKVRVKEV